jgi:hypothetical protein
MTATLVVREWRPGDTRLCRLCPTCTANHAKAICSVVTNSPVPRGHEALFSSHGMEIHRS